MKKLFLSLALGLSLLAGSTAALAQTPAPEPAAVAAPVASAPAEVTPDEAAPVAAMAAAAAPEAMPAEAAPTPTIDKGDTAWMMVSTMLVMLMVPGLALFYGGLVRSKNMLSVLMQVLVVFSL
ncbi:MAG: ammonium transporter, partial [Rhodoferax sp.]|nr:ammonium transporter [Rhodoferax sp.]